MKRWLNKSTGAQLTIDRSYLGGWVAIIMARNGLPVMRGYDWRTQALAKRAAFRAIEIAGGDRKEWVPA